MTTEVDTGSVSRVSVNGASLAVRSWPGDGPPLIAIHGLSSNSAFFVGVAERLAGRRPLHSIDLRGRGGSDKPDSGYGMAHHADDVAAIIDELDAGPAVVVGHSMGAAVAFVTAQRHPDRCAGVVLYDGGLHAFRSLADDQAALTAFLETGKGIEGRLGTTFASLADYEAYWAELGIFDGAQPRRWPSAYLAADLDGGEGAGERLPRCTQAAVAEDVGDLLSIAAATIEPVEAPVLAIAADNGLLVGTPPIVPGAAFTAMANDLPRFRGERIADSNHYTIALADPAASTTADLLVAHAELCRR